MTGALRDTTRACLLTLPPFAMLVWGSTWIIEAVVS